MKTKQENIFGVVGRAQRKLRNAKMHKEADELGEAVWGAQSYELACKMVEDYLALIPAVSVEEADAEWDRHWAGEEE